MNVAKEEMVLDSVLEWVRYDVDSRAAHLPDLLSEVQWPLVRNKRALRDALADPLIAACPRSTAAVKEAIRYHDLSYAKKVAYWKGRDRPSRWPKLLVALAYADTIIEAYDFEAQKWITLTEKPTVTFGAETCYVRGRVYAIGGVQSKQVEPETAHCTGGGGGVRYTKVARGGFWHHLNCP